MSKAFIPLSVPNFSGNEKEYVNEAVVSEWVSTGGSMVSGFEDKIAAYTGMPRAVACASGTAGLHLALQSAGIGAGDEVIVPTLTFIAAVNPVRYVNAEPVFIGCDDSLCIDPDAVEAFCRDKCELRADTLYDKATGCPVRAMLLVHVFGELCDMPRLMRIAQQYHLIVIEDATEALGSRYTEGPYTGKMAGTIGDIGVYSFNGNKIITTGSGGMLVANRDDWAQHAKHLSTQAKADELHFVHDEVGYNYRMTNLSAALGLAQLEQLEGFIERKHAMHAQYVQKLDGQKGLRVLPFKTGARQNKWFFSLYTKDAAIERDALMAALQNEKIQTRPIWALIHEQAPYRQCQAYAVEKAQDYRAHIVNLPCSTNLTDEDLQRVCDTVLSLV